MERTLGLVIPAYQPDIDGLVEYIETLHTCLHPAEIRIELDSPSPDVTEALATLPVTVHIAKHRRGKGAAITYGFEALSTDLLVFVDADGSIPASSLRDIIENLISSERALVVGSRRHPNAVIKSHQTFARRHLGDIFAFVARQLLDAKLYDYQCGAKAIHRDTWNAVRGHLYEPGFAWDIELIAVVAALSYPIIEVPVTWEDQPGSTVSPIRTPVELFRALVTARRKGKLLRQTPVTEGQMNYQDPRTALVDQHRWNDD